jgi:hypothetical protein
VRIAADSDATFAERFQWLCTVGTSISSSPLRQL